MYRKYETNQQRGVLDSFFAAAAEDEHRKEVLQSSDLANMFSMKHRETYIFDEDGRTQMVDKTNRHAENAQGVQNILKDEIEKIYPEFQKQFAARGEDMRRDFEATDGKIEGLSYGTPEYDKAARELVKIGTSLNVFGDNKGILDRLLFSIHEYSIGTITTANDFINAVTPDIASLKTLHEEGEIIVESVDAANP